MRIFLASFKTIVNKTDRVFMKKMIVKKDYVTEVQGVFEYLVEKFNLTPVLELVQMIIDMIISSVSNYAMVKALNEFLTKIVARLELFRKVSVF